MKFYSYVSCSLAAWAESSPFFLKLSFFHPMWMMLFSPFPSGAFAVCVWSTAQCLGVITAIHPLHHHPSLTPLLRTGPVSSVLAAGTSFPGWCQELGLPLCQYRACAEEQWGCKRRRRNLRTMSLKGVSSPPCLST